MNVGWLVLIVYVAGYLFTLPRLYRWLLNEGRPGVFPPDRTDRVLAAQIALCGSCFWPVLAAAFVVVAVVRDEQRVR